MLPNIPKPNRLFITAVVAAHVVFFGLACVFRRIYMGDSFEYIYEAFNIKNLFFFYSGSPVLPITPEYMTQRPPGYPLFLLSVYLFTINNWVVLALQNLISIFNIVHTRATIMKIGYRPRHDWLLLLLLLTYPAQLINANTVAPDILLQTFVVLYFRYFIDFIRERRLRYAIYMSLALVAGMMVKPVLYPFVPAHIVIVAVTALVLNLKMQRPMLIAVAPLCAVLLYNYWNYTRTGKFHFTSNQAFNAFYYYYPYISATQGADSANRFLTNERAAYNGLQDYSDRYDYANDEGRRLLRQNLAPYLAFHLRNSARMLVEPGKAEIDLFTGKLTYGRLYSKEQTGFYATLKARGWAGMTDYVSRNPSLAVAFIVFLFNCVRLAGLWRFLSNRNCSWLIRGFVLILIAYFVIAAGPIANTRYFLPVSLILAGVAAVGLTRKKIPT